MKNPIRINKLLTALLLLCVLFVCMAGTAMAESDNQVASVTTSDGQTTTNHTDINEAIKAAMEAENSTLTLLDAITTDSTVTINNGSFTIDLGGNTWTFSSGYLKISGDAYITITDSIDGAGKLLGTDGAYPTIVLDDDAILGITGGTVENAASQNVVDMSDSGVPTNAQLTVSGGALITTGYNAINAYGSLVKVTGGTIKTNGYDIYYHNGVIDLSEHEAPAGITISNRTGSAVIPGEETIKLPNNYVMRGNDGSVAESLANGSLYTVGKVATAADAVASVTTANDETSYHADINEAVTAAMASNGSTLTLLDNITTSDVLINSGSFTIDLNSKTWTFSSGNLEIKGTDINITITDCSADGKGKLLETDDSIPVIRLTGSAKLEIAGGTVENTGYSKAVSMDQSGNTTNAQLIVSGGQLITTGNIAIYAWGSLVKVTGGTIKGNLSNTYCDIHYETGVIDLSGHENPAGITIYNGTGAEVTPDENTIKLPVGYVMLDDSGTAADSLAYGGTYTVWKPGILASVTTADGQTTTYHADIMDAITAAMASSGSTLTLLDNITTDTSSGVLINSGSFTIDLNSKTWTSSSGNLYINGTDINITITDSSADGKGKLLETDDGNPVIQLSGSAKLEIAGGTVENTGISTAVNMSSSGTATSAQLTVSGGKLITKGDVAIDAWGSLVKVTGGTIKCNLKDIEYSTGVIDLSEHEDPAGITIGNLTGSAVIPGEETIKLPVGYVMLDGSGKAADSLAYAGIYTVGVAGVYTVTVNGSANGTVTADKTTAAEGDIVTLTVAPAEGSLLDLLTVTGASGAVEITAGEDNTYTFTMPASNVTVTAMFWDVTISEPPAGSVASVTTASGAVYYYAGINDAVNRAKQRSGSTLKLLDAISMGSEVTIDSGSFTIDLNGKTWTSPSAGVLRIEGTDTNITITDSMNGGTLESTYGGIPHAIHFEGGSVKISGGTIKGWIQYKKGAGELDLSGHNDPEGIELYTTGEASDPEKPVIKLPAGYVLFDMANNNPVTEPEWGPDYEVGKNPNAPTTYAVTVTAGEGGTVTANKNSAAENDTVELTVKPAEGYVLNTLTVTRESGNEVTTTGEGNTYTFTMPAEAVTVSATFTACDHSSSTHGTPTPDVDGSTHSFTCTVCGTTVSEACSGGTATCTEKAVCTKCGKSYGELAAHSLTYSVNESGDTITATCSANCGYTATATISAANAIYNGSAYTGATVAYSDNWPGGNLTIAYAIKDGAVLTEAPKDAGTYTAALTYRGVTAEKKFTISQKDITGATVGAFAEMTYNGAVQMPSAAVSIDGLTVTGTWSSVTNVSDKTTFTASGNFTGSIANQETGMKKATLSAADFIMTPPANLYYTGETKTATVAAANGVIGMGEITVKYSPENPFNTGSYDVLIDVAEGDNYLAATNLNVGSFTIGQSGSAFSDVKTYLGDTEKNEFTYGQTVTVKGNVQLTGEAPAQSFSLLRAFTAPAAKQVALFDAAGTTQLSAAAEVEDNGAFELTYDTTEKLVDPAASVTLMVKYVGDNNMANASTTVSIRLNACPVTPTLYGSVTKTYDGTTAVPAGHSLTIELTGKNGSDRVTASGSFAYEDASADTGKRITASSITLGGDDARFYTLSANTASNANGEITQENISPVAGSLNIANNKAHTYTYDLSQLLPALDGSKTYGNVSYALGTISLENGYTSGAAINGSTLSLPIEAVRGDGTEIGTISIAITSDNYAFTTNATITVKEGAQAPQISDHPVSASYYPGSTAKALTVQAAVSDGGTLSYQWYSNTTNSNVGGSPISGATGASYTPSTADTGTVYYYCVVTNTNNSASGDRSVSAASDVATITILPAAVVHDADITIIGQLDATYDNVRAKLMPLGSTAPLHDELLRKSDDAVNPEKYLYHAIIADGLYNLVVTAVEKSTGKEVTVTTLIDLQGHNDTHEDSLPEVGKSSIVDDDSSLGIIAGNVEDVAAAYAVASSGGSLVVTLTTEQGFDPATENTDAPLISQQAIQDQKTVEVKLDIDLMLQQFDASGAKHGDAVNLGSSNAHRLEILIPVKTAGRVPEGFAVYRVHNGKPQKLPYGSGDEYYIVDIGGEHIKLYVKRFSSYAIAYGEPVPQETPALPQTGDDSQLGLWLALMGASLVSMGALLLRRKRKFN